jgi:hypothetical protein
MARNSCGKRPCCICRKWFQPDVRQKGRQKTCGPDCQNELHRRQCEKWNRKNKAYFKNTYLGKKIEETVDQKTDLTFKQIRSKPRTKPILPIEIIATEYGTKPAIITQYLVAQIINYTHEMTSGFT